MSIEHPTAWEAANHMPRDVRIELSRYLAKAGACVDAPTLSPLLNELLNAMVARTDEENTRNETQLATARTLRRRAGDDPATFSEAEFELQLGVALRGTDRKLIKDGGGRYSACRGNSQTRFVHLPNTSANLTLAARLLNEHKDGRVVIRFMEASAVHYRRMGRTWTEDVLLDQLGQLARKTMQHHADRLEGIR